jgi:hypothetical protein
MKTYRVTQHNGAVHTVEARDQFSAVKKAAGGKGKVTWHGKHAECSGKRFTKPVQISE